VETTVGQWSFSWLRERHGLSIQAAGSWTSAYWASLTLGRLLLGASLAPIFPTLMARTPARVGHGIAHHAVGFQVSAAMLVSTVVPGLDEPPFTRRAGRRDRWGRHRPRVGGVGSAGEPGSTKRPLRARYVVIHHWENFFDPTPRDLTPITDIERVREVLIREMLRSLPRPSTIGVPC
jgi:hypothetical protein